MSPLEQKIYYPLAQLRTRFFEPVNKLFSALGIKADTISYLGVICMAGFIFALPNHKILAFWLLFARMLADIMDGPLARHQKTDNDRGKFVDVLMDNLAFALFVFGCVRTGLLHGFSGSVYLFVTELTVVLMIVRYNLKPHKTDWFFYASAGSLPYNFVYLSYILFSWWVFGGGNFLNGGAQLFSALMAARAISDYWAIQKAKP